MSSRPPPDYEDPDEIEAIREAKERSGDFKLKSAPDYVVPEHLRLNASIVTNQISELRQAVCSSSSSSSKWRCCTRTPLGECRHSHQPHLCTTTVSNSSCRSSSRCSCSCCCRRRCSRKVLQHQADVALILCSGWAWPTEEAFRFSWLSWFCGSRFLSKLWADFSEILRLYKFTFYLLLYEYVSEKNSKSQSVLDDIITKLSYVFFVPPCTAEFRLCCRCFATREISTTSC